MTKKERKAEENRVPHGQTPQGIADAFLTRNTTSYPGSHALSFLERCREWLTMAPHMGVDETKTVVAGEMVPYHSGKVAERRHDGGAAPQEHQDHKLDVRRHAARMAWCTTASSYTTGSPECTKSAGRTSYADSGGWP